MLFDVVDVPETKAGAGAGQTLHDVSAAGINFADTHHRLAAN
ncbi:MULTISPECIES: Zn-dependent oxidoreductase [unclassified Modestobacter]|nr:MULTISPECIES: Zn-dependent oxidoreductase [unclassified Modestobacter]MCZ2826946.1 Zn-dependent oxidoreductase [Modestobacter sp. VKM Ac-2981]MCZ2855358.1 Zn-dependent oxidoreductase [Modestobacter sp. VKM Ac-2982]